jgi:hypothetical protein
MLGAWRWMPISGRRSTASMLREMLYRISTRSQLLLATPQSRQLISTNRCRRTTRASVTPWISRRLKRLGERNLQKLALRGVGVQIDSLLPQPSPYNRGHVR